MIRIMIKQTIFLCLLSISIVNYATNTEQLDVFEQEFDQFIANINAQSGPIPEEHAVIKVSTEIIRDLMDEKKRINKSREKLYMGVQLGIPAAAALSGIVGTALGTVYHQQIKNDLNDPNGKVRGKVIPTFLIQLYTLAEQQNHIPSYAVKKNLLCFSFTIGTVDLAKALYFNVHHYGIQTDTKRIRSFPYNLAIASVENIRLNKKLFTSRIPGTNFIIIHDHQLLSAATGTCSTTLEKYKNGQHIDKKEIGCDFAEHVIKEVSYNTFVQLVHSIAPQLGLESDIVEIALPKDCEPKNSAQYGAKFGFNILLWLGGKYLCPNQMDNK